MSDFMAGKTVLITGGSAGIGRATAAQHGRIDFDDLRGEEVRWSARLQPVQIRPPWRSPSSWPDG